MSTKIEWCDEVWNPVWGCYNTCRYCYASSIAKRFGKTLDQKNFKPTWIESNYLKKFARKTKRVFVNSMSDVQYWQEEWWIRVLHRIRQLPDLTFIFLTKGHPVDVYGNRDYPKNVILGITVTGEWLVEMNPHVKECMENTHVRWLLNIEPLHGEIVISSKDFDWLIIGAETGNYPGKVIPDYRWVHGAVLEAVRNGIPVFFKPSMKPYIGDMPYLVQYPGGYDDQSQ